MYSNVEQINDLNSPDAEGETVYTSFIRKTTDLKEGVSSRDTFEATILTTGDLMHLEDYKASNLIISANE